MIDLTPKLFLVPTIVLVIVIMGCSLLAKRTANRLFFRKFIITLLCVGFLVNFIWELFHSRLYQGYVNDAQHVLISALASLADALMVLLLYAGFAFIFKNPYWIKSLTIKRIVLVVMVGGAGAIASEMIHVYRSDWAYTSTMPIVPVLNVGMSPVLQFVILPLTSYLLVFYSLKFGNTEYALKINQSNSL